MPVKKHIIDNVGSLFESMSLLRKINSIRSKFSSNLKDIELNNDDDNLGVPDGVFHYLLKLFGYGDDNVVHVAFNHKNSEASGSQTKEVIPDNVAYLGNNK